MLRTHLTVIRNRDLRTVVLCRWRTRPVLFENNMALLAGMRFRISSRRIFLSISCIDIVPDPNIFTGSSAKDILMRPYTTMYLSSSDAGDEPPAKIIYERQPSTSYENQDYWCPSRMHADVPSANSTYHRACHQYQSHDILSAHMISPKITRLRHHLADFRFAAIKFADGSPVMVDTGYSGNKSLEDIFDLRHRYTKTIWEQEDSITINWLCGISVSVGAI